LGTCYGEGGAENAGVEKEGVKNAGVDSRGGKCRSGKCRSDNRWKAVNIISHVYSLLHICFYVIRITFGRSM